MESALQPFVLLAKSAKGAGLSSIIRQALEAAGVYNFGELLYHPNVQALSSMPDQKKWTCLLEIFSFGTLSDYRKGPDLPELSKKELQKLKQLTVLSLAADRVLPYDRLLRELEVEDVRTLEDMLIDLITTGLLKANLDQRQRQVYIQDSAPRDVRMPTDLDRMLETLNQWAQNAARVQDALRKMEDMALSAQTEKENQDAAQQKATQKMQEQLTLELEMRGGGEGFGDPDEVMDELEAIGMAGGLGGVVGGIFRPGSKGKGRKF